MGDAVAATGFGLLASLVAGGLALGIADVEEFDQLAIWVLLLIQLPLWLGLAGIPWWASRTKGTGSLRRDFGLAMRWIDVPVGLAIGVATQLAFAVAAPPLYRFLGIDEDEIGETAERLVDRADDPFAVICLFFLVVIGAAVVEELCYRGLWQRAIAKRWNPTVGIVVSAVVFGAVHLQWYDFPLLTVFGLVLALLTARSGRLGPAIWAHLGFNLIALLTLL